MRHMLATTRSTDRENLGKHGSRKLPIIIQRLFFFVQDTYAAVVVVVKIVTENDRRYTIGGGF